MPKKEIIKILKEYVLQYIKIENYEGKKIINGCDINELLDSLEKDVVKSLEKDKIEVYW